MAPTLQFFDAFMPHGLCYVWQPEILWLHVLSDAAVAIAYFSIPVALYYFLRQKPDTPFRNVVVMFTIFIFACGLTHLMGIWIVWNGHYGVQGLLKAITAFASIGTAIMLYPVMPRLLALRSPAELKKSNTALQQEIVNRKLQESQTSKLQSELAHIGRLSTMGEMATGLAHELNQPLMAISQSSDTAMLIASETDQLDVELEECLKDIQQETQRAGEIIRALRQLVSKDSTVRDNIDINELCDQTIQLVMPEARSHNVLIKNLTQGNVARPFIDRVQIAQVLVNLLRNGLQAIADGDSPERVVDVQIKNLENAVSVSVMDTGPGISPSLDLFKPFETTKADGMGMGLSISRSIVEGHGGRLSAEGLSQGGTRMTFTLPL